MKALILCGGFATRLDPITYFVPKPLLPIGIAGKPIVEYILDDLILSGVSDIVLSTNAKFVSHFDYWVKNMSNKHEINVDFVVESTKDNNQKFGQIKGIGYAIEKNKIDTDLIIVAGDNFYNFSIRDVINDFKKHGKPIVGLYDIGSKEEAKKFGVVELSNGRISAFHEKPENPATTLVSTGIYLIPKDTLGMFAEYLKSGNNPDSIGYFIKWLSEKTEVMGHVYKGEWHDIGTLDTYRKVFDEYSSKGR